MPKTIIIHNYVKFKNKIKLKKKKLQSEVTFFFLPIMCYFKRNLQEVKDINLDKDDPVMNHMIIKENCSAII